MKILILTTDQELALLRQRVLEAAGHQVTPLSHREGSRRGGGEKRSL